jgi:transposase
MARLDARMTRLPAHTASYLADPHRGDKRAHAVSRLCRDGHSERKVAKMLGLNLSLVREILAREARR